MKKLLALAAMLLFFSACADEEVPPAGEKLSPQTTTPTPPGLDDNPALPKSDRPPTTS